MQNQNSFKCQKRFLSVQNKDGVPSINMVSHSNFHYAPNWNRCHAKLKNKMCQPLVKILYTQFICFIYKKTILIEMVLLCDWHFIFLLHSPFYPSRKRLLLYHKRGRRRFKKCINKSLLVSNNDTVLGVTAQVVLYYDRIWNRCRLPPLTGNMIGRSFWYNFHHSFIFTIINYQNELKHIGRQSFCISFWLREKRITLENVQSDTVSFFHTCNKYTHAQLFKYSQSFSK